jgi:tetratricopeptide (TPR) repeat protein
MIELRMSASPAPQAAASASAKTAPAPKSAAREGLIGDRYRIERPLGRGGMGEVLSVVEESSGKAFALKRLLPGAKARHGLLLAREFHTLHGLDHPNVVRAFDYALSGGTPYYTMELLAGGDVEGMAPMPWEQVVPILRDVASALALLHARHLVHRDVSARNVWRTPEGVVKLIDFGALTNFGDATDVAGTPPYLAPEALRSRLLDQRTDLFSLGALAYHLLTARHAFQARAFVDLEQHWAEGFAPLNARLGQLGRADLPQVPEALEQLVEGLLALEPQARPASAAEVLDRLDEILPEQGGRAPAAVQGVLLSKVFVGRGSELKRVSALLKRVRARMSASAALIGEEGSGRSRLLAQIALEARMAGVTVVLVSGDGDKNSFSAAARATLKVLEALPSLARSCAAPYARVLGHLSPELCAALAVDPARLESFPGSTGEARLRLSAALHAFWSALTGKEPVAILLDDFETMDEASAALFATLPRASGDAQILVVAAVRTERGATIPERAQAQVEKAVPITLAPLVLDECTAMLRSIFGDAEHLARTARYLADKSEGNPGRLMALCEHLVHSGVVRWIEGAWVLPQEITSLELPDTQQRLIEANVARLSAEARSLASALSVVEEALSLELCAALSPLPQQAMFAALNELSVSGVLVASDDMYRFRSEAVRSVAYDLLSVEQAARAHGAAGDAALRAERPDHLQRVTAGLHLLRAQRGRDAAAIVIKAAADAAVQLPEGYAEIGKRIEQALPLLRALGLNQYELQAPLCVLAWCGYFADRRFGFVYGDEALACSQQVCGMHRARRLSRWFGKRLGLYLALIIAAILFRRARRKSPLVHDLKLGIRMLMLASASLCGMYTVCIARNKVAASVAAIEPLTAFGPDHIASIVYQFGVGCLGTATDHLGATRRHWERLVARLDDPRPIKQLDATRRAYYAAASLYAWGATEAWRDKSRALEIADRLERQPLKLYQLTADQLRAIYYAHQGNQREARHYRARVETRALQRGMTWQVEIWDPTAAISVGMRQHDAMRVKQAAGQLSHLSADTPTLRPSMVAARAAYLLLRGRYDEAVKQLEAQLKVHDPETIGYANAIAQLAKAYNGLGRFADAKAACERVLPRLHEDDLAYPILTLPIQIELALADAGLGDVESAGARLDALIERHTPGEGPLTLGALHEARTSVALRAQDERTARRHLEAMEGWYRGTDCPSLIQHCDRIARRWQKLRGVKDAPYLPSMSFLANIGTKLTSSVISDPPQQILEQLVRGARATEGVLVFSAQDAPQSLIKTRPTELPEGLASWIETRTSQAFLYSTATEDSVDDEPVDVNVISFEQKTWRLSLLVSDDGDAQTVVGAIALCNPLTQIPLDLLRVLAAHLKGDALRTLSSRLGGSLPEGV